MLFGKGPRRTSLGLRNMNPTQNALRVLKLTDPDLCEAFVKSGETLYNWTLLYELHMMSWDGAMLDFFMVLITTKLLGKMHGIAGSLWNFYDACFKKL